MLTRPSEVAGQIPSVPEAVATKLLSHFLAPNVKLENILKGM